jgi:hypothetical protein
VSEESFPLAWPAGWPRTQPARRQSAAFGTKPDPQQRVRDLSAAEATARLERELDLLGARRPVLSTNVESRLDGRPRSDRANPTDPGAAVYFTLKDRRTVLACDRWVRVADNIAAIAAHVKALRGIERWGVGSLEQAFRGYLSIEDFSKNGVPWRRVLGFGESEAVDLDAVTRRFRLRALPSHPDQGGSHEAMAELNRALADARKELGGTGK